MPDHSEERTLPRPRTWKQYDLRHDGLSYILVHRFADNHGLDYEGNPAPWKDCATIKEWGAARDLLAACRAVEHHHRASVTGSSEEVDR